MSVIIGIEPSKLGYNQICFMDGDLKVLDETQVKGHQETIAAIAEWIKKRRKSHKEKDFKLGIQFRRNILELAVKELNIPVFSIKANQLKKFIISTKMTKTARPDAATVCKYLAIHGLTLQAYEPVSPHWEATQLIADQLSNIRRKRTLAWQMFENHMHEFTPQLRHLLKDKMRSQWFLDLIKGPFAKKGFQQMQIDELASLCKSDTVEDKQLLEALLKELKLLQQNDILATLLADSAAEMALINAQDKAWRARAEQVSQVGGVPLLDERARHDDADDGPPARGVR